MTIILSTSVLVMLLSYVFYRQIHKYRYIIYAVFVLLALLIGEAEANVVSMGYVPFGIFLVVMMSGVMDKGTLKKRLFMVRAELAVIASILLAPHALAYLEYYLDDVGFFNGGLSFYLGVISLLLVLPLFLTSFQFVRKYMGYKNWKKLHKLSYIFYAMIGLHLILIGNDRLWLYVIIFSTYVVLKVFSSISLKQVKNEQARRS